MPKKQQAYSVLYLNAVGLCKDIKSLLTNQIFPSH